MSDQPPAEFDSLADLREQHIQLLSKWRSAKSPAERREQAEAFRARAARIGRWLTDPVDRDVAEGILDYWTAALGGLPGAIPDEPPPLAEPDEAAIAAAGGKAEAVAETLTKAERDWLEALLAKLLVVDAEGRRVPAPPVNLADVQATDSGAPDTVRQGEIITALVEAHALTLRERDAPMVALAYLSVAQAWPTGAKVFAAGYNEAQLIQRLQNSAEAWKANEGDRSYLWTGEELRRVTSLQTANAAAVQIDPVTEKFLAASKESQKRATMFQRGAIGVATLGATASAMAWFWLLLTEPPPTSVDNAVGIEQGLSLEQKAEVAQETEEVAANPMNDLASAEAVREVTGRTGMMFIGFAEEPFLRDPKNLAKIDPRAVETGKTYVVRFDTKLRVDWPSNTYASAREKSIVRAGSLVQVRVVKDFDRPDGPRYWAEVKQVPKIFIHYPDAGRSSAQTLARSLATAGFDVERPDEEPYRGPDQVRYFHPEDRAAAEQAARSMHLALPDRAVPDIVRVKSDDSSNQGWLEIWLGS